MLPTIEGLSFGDIQELLSDVLKSLEVDVIQIMEPIRFQYLSKLTCIVRLRGLAETPTHG